LRDRSQRASPMTRTRHPIVPLKWSRRVSGLNWRSDVAVPFCPVLIRSLENVRRHTSLPRRPPACIRLWPAGETDSPRVRLRSLPRPNSRHIVPVRAPIEPLKNLTELLLDSPESLLQTLRNAHAAKHGDVVFFLWIHAVGNGVARVYGDWRAGSGAALANGRARVYRDWRGGRGAAPGNRRARVRSDWRRGSSAGALALPRRR
jgi:hypothetical protein